ncbi:MAG: helix-turn-helix transcriptional regulator [bacterium]
MEEKTIGQKIKDWRKIKNMTQDSLSKKAGIPYATIAKIESDVILNPSIGTVKKISQGLEITIDQLIS